MIALAFLAGAVVGACGVWWAVIHDDMDGGNRVVADRWWLANEDRWLSLRRHELDEAQQ